MHVQTHATYIRKSELDKLYKYDIEMEMQAKPGDLQEKQQQKCKLHQ